MRHPSGSSFHRCVLWLALGMACPFADGGEEDVEGDDPPDDVPPVGVPVGTPPHLLLASRRARVSDVLGQAEEIVARAAESIPVVIGSEVKSLAERLGVPGAVAGATGAAAAFAIRQVGKRIAAKGGFGGFAGGGFSFPSVFDPAKAFRSP